jgi:hypothetical protein
MEKVIAFGVLSSTIWLECLYILVYEFVYKQKKTNRFNILIVTGQLSMAMHTTMNFLGSLSNSNGDFSSSALVIYMWVAKLSLSVEFIGYLLYLYYRSVGILSQKQRAGVRIATWVTCLVLLSSSCVEIIINDYIAPTYLSFIGMTFLVMLDIFYVALFLKFLREYNQKSKHEYNEQLTVIANHSLVCTSLSLLSFLIYLGFFVTGDIAIFVTVHTFLSFIPIAMFRMMIKLDEIQAHIQDKPKDLASLNSRKIDLHRKAELAVGSKPLLQTKIGTYSANTLIDRVVN